MKIISKNKKAFFSYEILEKYTAGIKLLGSEVKSIRLNNVNISNSYCVIINGEIFIRNMNISPYEQGSTHNNHEPLRERKLLLNKREILKLDVSLKNHLTIIPLAIILSNTSFIKIEIGLAKGKNTYDKRSSLKEKDLKRELQKNL